MTDPYLHNREFFGTVSGNYRIVATDTGLIVLVPSIPAHTLFIQKLHIEVTTVTGAELWTFQDGAAIPIVPSVSAAAVTHFDFDFGPDGVPCTQATAFVLNITGAVGAVGWVSWEGFKKLTLGTAPIVGGAPTAADAGTQTITTLQVINGIGIGSGVPTASDKIKIVDDRPGSNVRIHLENTSTAPAAFADVLVRAGSTSAYMGASNQNYGAGALGSNRSWLDTSPAIAGCGWDISAGHATGSIRFLTGGYAAGNIRATIDSSGLSASSLRATAVTFANLPAAPVEGMLVPVTDATLNTWGSVVAGGGANHVLAYYNGTAWTIAGK